MILRGTVESHSSKEGTHARSTAHDVDVPAVLADRLTTTHPDVPRELLATFIHNLMGAPRLTPCAALATASAKLSEPTPATGIVTANSTSAQFHWISRSLSCAKVSTSRTSCRNAANEPSGP